MASVPKVYELRDKLPKSEEFNLKALRLKYIDDYCNIKLEITELLKMLSVFINKLR